MSSRRIRYIAQILLVLYIGYFGCVSYFVHKHVYQGVVYIHSHPYKKTNTQGENTNEPPFETHKHTSAGFFSLNQISNYTSFEAVDKNPIERTDNLILNQYINRSIQIYKSQEVTYFRLRAPPCA